MCCGLAECIVRQTISEEALITQDLVDELSDHLVRDSLQQLTMTVASCDVVGVAKDIDNEDSEMVPSDGEEGTVELDAATKFKNLPSAADQVLATIVASIQTSKALKDFTNVYQLLSLLSPSKLKVKEITGLTNCSENAVKMANKIARSPDSYPGAAVVQNPKCVRQRIKPTDLLSFIEWFSKFLRIAEDNRKNNKGKIKTEYVMQSDPEGVYKLYSEATLSETGGKKLSRSTVLGLISCPLIGQICAEEASCATCTAGHLALVDLERISAELEVTRERLAEHNIGGLENLFLHLQPKIEQVKAFMSMGYVQVCLRHPNNNCCSHDRIFGVGHPYNDHYAAPCNHGVDEPSIIIPPGIAIFSMDESLLRLFFSLFYFYR